MPLWWWRTSSVIARMPEKPWASAGRRRRRSSGRGRQSDHPRDVRGHRARSCRWLSCGGLMGPYMRPIPVGASAAMLFSLLVAFVVSPWAAVRLLKRCEAGHGTRAKVGDPAVSPDDGTLDPERPRRWMFLGGVVVLLLAAWRCSAQRSSGQDAALRQQERVPGHRRHAGRNHAGADGAGGCGARRGRVQGRRGGQLSRPTSAPPSRTTSTAWCGTTFCAADRIVADIQVNLLPKRPQRAKPRDCAKRVARTDPANRPAVQRHSRSEVPPGPPVLQTLVAEVYGPIRQGASSSPGR